MVGILGELKKMECNKKRLTKINAMLIIANSQKRAQKNHNRNEIRYYWCDTCNAYHVTSKK